MQTDQILNSALVIAERVDIRGVLREALKAVGVKKVISLSNVSEAYDYFPTSESIPGMIFMTLEESNSVNWISFLAAKLNSQELTDTIITVLVNEDNISELPIAYELGATCHIKMPFTHNDIVSTMNVLIDQGERCKWSTYEIASNTFREYLNDSEKFEELVSLEQAIVDRFPDKPEFLIKLAEAKYSLGFERDAGNILKRASMLGGDIKNKASQLKDLINADLGTGVPDFSEVFEMEKIMIVDSDGASRNLTKECLEKLGTFEYLEFESAIDAFESYDFDTPPDLLITEWKLPKLGGMQFIQRIVDGSTDLPLIIVTSSNIKEADMPLLKEIYVAGFVEKPILQSTLQSLIVNKFVATKVPRDAESIYNKIHLAARNEDLHEALKLYGTYRALDKKNEVITLLIEAEINYLKGFFDEAKKHAYNAFVKSGGSLAANALIVKILVKLKLPIDAMKTLNWAQNVSPKNISRICQIAELHSEMGNREDADQFVEKAGQIDKDAPLTQETSARVALNSGDTSTVKKILMNMDSLTPLITYMNNRAVALVRQGEVDKGIKLYNDALEALPEERLKEKSAILYNLGLAFARINRLPESSEELTKIIEAHHPRLYSKVKNLKKNVDTAMKRGVALSFQAQDARKNEKLSTYIPIAWDPTPGKFGLHLIYMTGKIENDRIQEYLKSVKPITFPTITKNSA